MILQYFKGPVHWKLAKSDTVYVVDLGLKGSMPSYINPSSQDPDSLWYIMLYILAW